MDYDLQCKSCQPSSSMLNNWRGCLPFSASHGLENTSGKRGLWGQPIACTRTDPERASLAVQSCRTDTWSLGTVHRMHPNGSLSSSQACRDVQLTRGHGGTNTWCYCNVEFSELSLTQAVLLVLLRSIKLYRRKSHSGLCPDYSHVTQRQEPKS